MKVIILNDYAYVEGGASNIAINSAILLSISHEVVFFSPVGPIDPRLNKANIKVICLNEKDLVKKNVVSSFLSGLWNSKSKNTLNHYIETLNNEDINIFIHSWTKNLSPSIFKVLLKKNIKTCLVNHDYFSICPNGGFYFFKQKKKCKLKPLSSKCILSNCDSRSYQIKLWRVIRQYIFNHYFKQLLNDKLKMIYVSDFSKNIFHKHIDSYHDNIVIENPIFTDRLIRKIDVIKNYKIGFLGRLSEEKGVLFMARNLSHIAEKVVFIGDGVLKNEIKKINKKFEITGWLDKENVNDELSNLRAIIFPSQLNETDGLAVKEAGVKGIPSIVFTDIAAANNLTNNHNAILINKNSPEQLDDAINKIFNDEILSKLSENCFKYFNNLKFSQKTFYKKLISCFN